MKKKGGEGRQGVLHDHTVAYTTHTHTLTHAHRGLLVRAGLSGKLDLKADNF